MLIGNSSLNHSTNCRKHMQMYNQNEILPENRYFKIIFRIHTCNKICIIIYIYLLFKNTQRKHTNSYWYSTMRHLSICVFCALFVFALLSTSSKATQQCDGQLFTKLDKIQSSINNIWKRKPKPIGKYMYITHGRI